MARIYELRQKEIINIKDGARMGFVADVEINDETGEIENLIVPGPAKVFGVFGREMEYVIPWDAIKRVGDDIILVDVDTKECEQDYE